MKIRHLALALASASLLAGCATKDYVNEQISSVNQRIDSQQADTSTKLGQNTSLYQALENRVNSQQTAIDKLSRTSQEALDRANQAGKLAEGKFLYEVVVSSNINFDFSGSKLAPDMEKTLDAFAAQLKGENKNVFVEIQGHTDSIGEEGPNMALGQARADNVRHYLAIKGGIPLHRMHAISYGESAPVASNINKAGRAENRRVTLVVLQ